MTFKSKLLRVTAKKECSTCIDSPEACTEEPNAIEKFLNDASSAVATVFQEAADDVSSEGCSTITDPSESFTYTYTTDTETETDIDTRAGEDDAQKIFLNKDSVANSGAVGSAVEEASSIAGDMHTIVMADVDEKSARKEEDKQKNTTELTTSFFNTIKLKKNRSNATAPKPAKKTSTCTTREDETNTEQPTCVNTEVKGNPATLARVMNKLHKRGVQLSSSNKEAKESPATLAKLMTKLDKKKKQIDKINQQISKTEEEVVETKKSIRALAAKYRGVLVLDGDEGDQTSIKQVESDEARDDQTLDDHIGFGLSDEDLTFDYESMLDEEERDDDAIDLALKYTSSRLLALEKAANQEYNVSNYQKKCTKFEQNCAADIVEMTQISHLAMNFKSKLPRVRNSKEAEAVEPNAIEKFFNGVFPEAADDEWSECESDFSDSSEVREPMSHKLGFNNLAMSFRSKLQRHRSSSDAYAEERNDTNSSNMAVKRNPATLAKLMTKFDKKEEHIEFLNQQLNKTEEEAVIIKKSIKEIAAKYRGLLDGDESRQPDSSNMAVKGSPTTLAKLMKKLDNKKKQIEFVKQQLHKTEEEVVETKKSIKEIAARYQGVL